MQQWQLKTPVAFLIFNRVDTTQRVFEAIRQARPPRLLVVADGPRADRPDEKRLCQATRAIVEKVDWPCEVQTNFSEHNMGCRRRISSGLDWIFRETEEAIVLEDDCLPCQSFFRFSEELLERYRYDQRVAMISGDNFQFGKYKPPYSYYFSRYSHIWGWASWRRSWAKYDENMKLYPQVRDNGLLPSLVGNNADVVRYWKIVLDETYAGAIDTWDYQFGFGNFLQNALCIMPAVNLISNIGFGANATRTQEINKFAAMKVEDMLFPLQHPPYMIRDMLADAMTEREQYSWPLLSKTNWHRNKGILRKFIRDLRK